MIMINTVSPGVTDFNNTELRFKALTLTPITEFFFFYIALIILIFKYYYSPKN